MWVGYQKQGQVWGHAPQLSDHFPRRKPENVQQLLAASTLHGKKNVLAAVMGVVQTDPHRRTARIHTFSSLMNSSSPALRSSTPDRHTAGR